MKKVSSPPLSAGDKTTENRVCPTLNTICVTNSNNTFYDGINVRECKNTPVVFVTVSVGLVR